MKCEDVQTVMHLARDEVNSAERRLADEHLLTCADCCHALDAMRALEAERETPVPAPRREAFDQAMFAATQRPSAAARQRRGFWPGVGLGAALAAGVALAIIAIAPMPGGQTGAGTPVVTMALDEVRDISISLDSPEPLDNAEIHVTLSGGIDLQGFEGRRELRWATNLDRGVNKLTLPVVASSAGGGQLLVEVQYGGKRKTFLVDIRA